MRKRNLLSSVALYVIASYGISASHANAQSSSVPVSISGTNTGLDIATNGVPIINIAKPDAEGTSYNGFNTFNVGSEGIIFNNSTTIQISQLAGSLYANARLEGRNANLIIGEVKGGFNSSLNGMIEIFGSKAGLVIANPYGISCNGCGFINTSRATLATGTTEFRNGQFYGLNISNGNFDLNGNGLFANSTDFFDIISNSARINANIFANDLIVSAGNQSFDYKTRNVLSNNVGSTGVAIDTSALGGIYAGKIKIIGTNKGMGINLGGIVASANDGININGDHVNINGKLSSYADIDIKASGTFTLSQNSSLDAFGVGIDSSEANINGTIEAFDKIKINSLNNINIGSPAVLKSTFIERDTGLGRDLGEYSNINLNANWAVNNYGRIETYGSLSAKSLYNSVNNLGFIDAASAVNLQALNGDVTGYQNVRTNALGLILGRDFVNNGDYYFNGDLLIDARNIVNNSQFRTDGSLFLNGQNALYNNGIVSSQSDVVLSATNYLGISNGNLFAKDNIYLSSDSVAVYNSKINAELGDINLLAKNINSSGRLGQITEEVFHNFNYPIYKDYYNEIYGIYEDYEERGYYTTISRPNHEFTTFNAQNINILATDNVDFTLTKIGSIFDTQISGSNVNFNASKFLYNNQEVLDGISVNTGGNFALLGDNLNLFSANISSGGMAYMNATNTLNINGITRKIVTDSYIGGGTYHSEDNKFTSTNITSQNGINLNASNLNLVGTNLATSGTISLYGQNSVNLTSGATSYISNSNQVLGKRHTIKSMSDGVVDEFTNLTAAGNIIISTQNNLNMNGVDAASDGDILINAKSINIAATKEIANSSSEELWKKKRLLSTKKTVTTTQDYEETIEANNLTAKNISILGSDSLNIKGSYLGSVYDTILTSNGNINIDADFENDESLYFTRTKTSGITFDGGLFIGVSKSSTQTNVDTAAAFGSTIVSGRDIIIAAKGQNNITASDIMAGTNTYLKGSEVNILNTYDTQNSRVISKQSSTGISVKLYENVTNAINSIKTLQSRASSGTGGSAQEAVTAVSETIRTVSAVQNAFTNTFGISANIGSNSSSTSSNTSIQKSVGSYITGNNVFVEANAGDISLIGSKITAKDSVYLDASRDINALSAQDIYNYTTKSQSSGISVGASLGFSIIGTPNASANVSISASRSNASENTITHVGSFIDAGGLLNIKSGRDTNLSYARFTGRDINLDVGNNLNIISLQNTILANSNAYGGGLSLNWSGMDLNGLGHQFGFINTGSALNNGSGFTQQGLAASINYSNGNTNSAIVAEQSGIFANDGSLNAIVKGTTLIKGGVLAAMGANGLDSGRLNLKTGKLIVQDIYDYAENTNYELGFSFNYNDPFRYDFYNEGNDPIFDVGYSSSSFAQITRGAIGRGNIAISDTLNSTPISNLYREIGNTQIVTKDKQSSFTAYFDRAATIEAFRLISFNRDKSNILDSVGELFKDFDGDDTTKSLLAQDLINFKLALELTQKNRQMNDYAPAKDESISDFEIRLRNMKATNIFDGEVKKLQSQGYSEQQAIEKLGGVAAISLIADSVDYTELHNIKNIVASGENLTDVQAATLNRLLSKEKPQNTEESQQNTNNEQDSETIYVIGKRKYNSIEVDQAIKNVIVNTAQKARFINEHLGGMVEGTGTGMVDNNAETIRLLTDTSGYLLYKLSNGSAFQKEALKTQARIDTMVTLVKLVRDDPAKAASALGQALVEPYLQSYNYYLQKRNYEGTKELSYSSYGMIFSAMSGTAITAKFAKLGETAFGKGNFSVDASEIAYNLKGSYDPNKWREYLKDQYGKENVASTTIVNNPLQRVNSNPKDGVRVVGVIGNRAVEIDYIDPVTGLSKTANIAYDSRGLPIFDDIAKYTTNIDKSLSYEGQMVQATKDLWKAIVDGRVDKKQFTAKQLQYIKNGNGRIPDFTWHHNAQSGPNNMQLIPKEVHKKISHIGQNALNKGK